MAGGKETPRQKMIGMMYLVLTAMLALNVSKSIIEAFCAIDANIQIANDNAWSRGNEKKAELKEVATDPSNPTAQDKAKLMLVAIDKIEEATAKRIKYIDDLKLKLLTDVKEDLTIKGEKAIIEKAYDVKNPAKPAVLNLYNVSNKEDYDAPMRLVGITKSLKAPEGDGIKLWNEYLAFRGEITKIYVESTPKPASGPAYSFKDPNITKYKDMADLKKQVLTALEKSNVPKDEKDQIADLYIALTKNERVLNIDKEELHWVGKTFDHSPVVAALASLSSLQNEILTARANVISWIRNRVGGGEYSFNKVVSLAYGPDLVNANDSLTVEVLMAAFDSDRQPEVTWEDQKITEVRDGKGYVRTKAGAADMKLKGTITIKKKDGSPKTMDWEKEVKVMKPSASLMLPDLMVLYKGYPNKVKGVASGYDQTILNASAGITLVKSGDMYIANVAAGAGKTGTISVSGKSSVSGKTANLGTFTFAIKRLPDPQLFINGKAGGQPVTKNASVITAGYGPEIPLTVNFTVQSWSLGAEGINGKATGAGTNLSARNILVQAASGKKVFVDAKVVGPDGVVRIITGVYPMQ